MDGPHARAAPRITLWGAMTSRTLRAVWALHELDLPYAHRPIRSRSGETRTDRFTALNPRQKIPVLQDGDLTLAESAAIVSYLAERYGGTGGRPRLIPEPGTTERALYYQWCFFTMTELDAHTLYVLRKHRDLVHTYGDAPNALAEAEAGFRKQVAVAALALEDGRDFIVGDALTGADILLASIVGWAAAYRQPVPDALAAYARRLAERPAYRSAYAANYDVPPP